MSWDGPVEQTPKLEAIYKAFMQKGRQPKSRIGINYVLSRLVEEGHEPYIVFTCVNDERKGGYRWKGLSCGNT